jgi:hypothetical protein
VPTAKREVPIRVSLEARDMVGGQGVFGNERMGKEIDVPLSHRVHVSF